MQINSVIPLAYKIAISEPTHESKDIFSDYQVYVDRNWYRYDTDASDSFAYLIDVTLNKFCYIKSSSGKVHTRLPGIILGQNVNINTPYSDLRKINALIFSNIAVFLFTTSVSLRVIMFVERDYLDTFKTIPTPEMFIEYELTGKMDVTLNE